MSYQALFASFEYHQSMVIRKKNTFTVGGRLWTSKNSLKIQIMTSKVDPHATKVNVTFIKF